MQILLENHVLLMLSHTALRFVWNMTLPRSSFRRYFVTLPVMLLAAWGPPILICFYPQDKSFIYAGSNSGVVQAPVAFCGKHSTCEDCVLARDPYCAWSPARMACVVLHESHSSSRYPAAGCGACRCSACPTSRARTNSVPLVLQGSDSGDEWGYVCLSW